MTNAYQDELPDPEEVLRAAENEMPQRVLDDYTEAIHALRDKNFTFREIAEWLKKFGFEVDHNAVYRAYAKTVSDERLEQETRDEERQEQDDAERDASLNGRVVVASPAPEKSVRKSTKGKKGN